MCDAAAIGMGIMAMASTAMSIKAQNDQAEVTVDAANKSAASDYIQQTEQQSQVGQQAALDKSERARQAMIERASLRTAQGESGLSGASLGKELGATDFTQTYDSSLIEANKANKIRQIQYEKEGTKTTAQGRINMANSQKTSGWQAGLQIGMAGASGAAQGRTMGKNMGLGDTSKSARKSTSYYKPDGEFI